MTGGHWGLVGRHAQLARIAAASRSPGSLVVAGEAGVGKTRVAREAALAAEADGRRTAWVAATGVGSTIPLGAFAPLLPPFDDAHRPESALDILRRARHLLESGSAADDPLVLVVDDADLLDDASAALVHQLAAGGVTFVLATVRRGRPRAAPDAVIALWKDGGDHVELQPLTRAQVGALLAGALGGDMDAATVRQFWEASRGNPLYLRELVVGALDAGVLEQRNGVWVLARRLGASVRLTELVELRLGALSEAERGTLELLALAEPLPLAAAESVQGEDAVAAVEDKGLVTVTRHGRRGVAALAHPIYGEALRARIPETRRRRLLWQVAATLESWGCRRHGDVLRVARWRLDVGDQGDPDLLLEAARQARFAFEFELAERLARAARASGRRSSTPGGSGGVDADQLLGEVLFNRGRHHEAERLLAAAEAADGVPDAERALLVTTRADNLFWGLGRFDAAIAALDSAAARMGDGEVGDELVAQRGAYELLRGRPAEALDTVAALLEGGRGRPFVVAATAAAPALALTGRPDDAASLAMDAFAARLALGDQPNLADTGIHLVSYVLALLEGGRLTEAQASAEAGYDTAVGVSSRLGQAWFACSLGRVALTTGRVATANRCFREASVSFAELDLHGPRRWCVAGVAWSAALLGDAAAADGALAELAALPDTPDRMMEPELDRARAWVAISAGEVSRGCELLHAAAANAREAGQVALEAGALHDLARLGTRGPAPTGAIERLEQLAASCTARGGAGALLPWRAAHARGLLQRDAGALDAVSAELEASGATLWAAEAATVAARVHRERGHERRGAASSLGAARLLDACEGARTPLVTPATAGGIAGPAPLTRREREIATLAARGLANRAIAERLVVSVRTVENHLQQAYVKLGVRRRTELAGSLGA